MPVLHPQHAPLLGRIAAWAAAEPGAPKSFIAKFQLIADPVRGAVRTNLLEYELAVADSNPKGMVVLDAGSGTGLYSVMFALLGATRVEALDFFPENVEYLSRLARAFDLPIVARKCDIAATGLPGSSIGLVYCTEAISHFHDSRAFLDEAARVLQPGGRIIIADGNNGANPGVKRGIHEFWFESEAGPFTAETYPAGKNAPYLFRRWMIIRRTFPEATDEQVFQLGLRTSNLGGEELVAACRESLASGKLPSGGYTRGQSQRRPEDGQRNEEPLDPSDIAAYLRGRGVNARARAHFGYSRHPLLPILNEAASWLGPWPLRYAARYLVLGSK